MYYLSKIEVDLKDILKENTKKTIQEENRKDCHLGEIQQQPQRGTLKMKTREAGENKVGPSLFITC